eukprot:m.50275 g.50275  ORF g.50275 m.50275 type:complete len:154 (+) comp15371_c0_seq3:383-844(+)
MLPNLALAKEDFRQVFRYVETDTDESVAATLDTVRTRARARGNTRDGEKKKHMCATGAAPPNHPHTSSQGTHTEAKYPGVILDTRHNMAVSGTSSVASCPRTFARNADSTVTQTLHPKSTHGLSDVEAEVLSSVCLLFGPRATSKCWRESAYR